jgi:hypothetical protein
MRTLQKFASLHATVNNDFDHEIYLVRRQACKQRHPNAIAEWGALIA